MWLNIDITSEERVRNLKKPPGFTLDIFRVKKSTDAILSKVINYDEYFRPSSTILSSTILTYNFILKVILGQQDIIFFPFVQWRDISQNIS